MKIATFNVNNVNKRLANLLDWLRTAKPDVVSLQELKAGRGAGEGRGRRPDHHPCGGLVAARVGGGCAGT